MRSDLRTLAVCWLIDRSGRERVETMGPDQIRRRRASAVPHWWPASLLTGSVARGVRLVDRDLPLDEVTLRARVYTPPGASASSPLPLVVYFHGGGWVLGHLSSYDALCSQLAAQVGAVVVSVDYRLAPEHPMPTAAEDAYAATVWLAGHAATVGADRSRVAVAGDSAGGNLAAVVALLARDRGGPSIAHQVLIYPATDMVTERPALDHFAASAFLSAADRAWYHGQYVPEEQRRDPRASPLLADSLAGLPPAVVVTAGFDPLRDEGEAYAAALSEAGVPVVSRRHPGLVHGFANMTGIASAARDATLELAGTVRSLLHARSCAKSVAG